MFSVNRGQASTSSNTTGSDEVECCTFCGAPVPGTYYRLDIRMACVTCGEKIRHERNAVFVRAVIFGFAAAIAGFALYATIEMATGWMASAVSLIVGLMVGKAMIAGSGGGGERRYQISAVVLTYAAFAVATVPVSMVYAAKPATEQRVDVSGSMESVARSSAAPAVITPMRGASTTVHLTRSSSTLGERERLRLAVALAMQLLAALASPFLVLIHHFYQAVFMVIILLIGMRIAWNTARGKQIPVLYGPF